MEDKDGECDLGPAEFLVLVTRGRLGSWRDGGSARNRWRLKI